MRKTLYITTFAVTTVVLLFTTYSIKKSINSKNIKIKQSTQPNTLGAKTSKKILPLSNLPPWGKSEFWQKPDLNPVLLPTEPWEEKNVLEPTVLYEDGIFKMWYCGGATCALGYATSIDGITWTKHPNNPIFGNGAGGEQGVVRQNNVMRYDGKYYLFYVGDTKDMYLATSNDGIHWNKHTKPVLLHDDTTWEKSLANSFQWVENGKWYMLYEAQNSDPYALWQIGLATSDNPYTWQKFANNPLKSVQTSKGMYGGPWIKKIADNYYLFHHASVVQDNLPTDTFVHVSRDLTNWTLVSKDPLISRTQPEWELDQTADPSLVEANGKTYIFYDGNDNSLETGYRAWIGFVVYDGILKN